MKERRRERGRRPGRRSRYLLLRRIPRVIEVVVLILGRYFWLQVVLGIVLVLIMGVMNTIVTLLGLKRYWRGKQRRRPHAHIAQRRARRGQVYRARLMLSSILIIVFMCSAQLEA